MHSRRRKRLLIKNSNIIWQEPVITEKIFFEQNQFNINYIAFPWAQKLDYKETGLDIKDLVINKNEDNYTCCQHVYFRKLISLFKNLNINTVYTPHKIKGEDEINGIKILPCPLYAVNVEDKKRNNLFNSIDFLNKKRDIWYSFQGSYANYYMSDIRKKIFSLKDTKNNKIINNGNEWHFDKAVYKNDIKIDEEKLENYNNLLLNSRFSLCPSGSGPNSIRFWESLAAGSIPVLLSDKLDLPSHELWDKAIVKMSEKEIENIEKILREIDEKKEIEMRANCLKIYSHFKDNYTNKVRKNNFDTIVHYCCGSYFEGNYGGVARYDYQVWKTFHNRVFFQGPRDKLKMLKFLENKKNPLVITDNHLSCDIPNKYMVLLIHHGCARTTAERNPDWGEPWKSLCVNGQNKMLTYRSIRNTKIVSISQSCSDDFTKYYGQNYTKFNRVDILHPSELDENRYKTKFNDKPIVLGNWVHVKKGQALIPTLKKKLNQFTFQQLDVKLNGNDFDDFNRRKQDIYLNADIFLQIGNSEGNSYATLDALLCGMVIVASNVGLFYKDVPDNCFVKLEWEKNNNIKYVESKLIDAWERREELSKNARKWYLDNYRFIDWEKKMKDIISS